MIINERFIKISGRIPTKKELNLGDDVVVGLDAEPFVANVVKIEELDNQDGSKDLVYVLKFLSE